MYIIKERITFYCYTTVVLIVFFFWRALPEERLNVVEAFVDCAEMRHAVHKDQLRRIPDFQRIAKKFSRRRASLQDCYRVYQAVGQLPHLLETLEANAGKYTALLMELFSNPIKVSWSPTTSLDILACYFQIVISV